MICPHCLYGVSLTAGRCDGCGRVRDVATPPPLVGRSRELALLAEELEWVQKNRRPRIVALVGERRVGISRLMTEFRRRHENEFSDLRFLRGYAVPGALTADPFLPFGRLVRNALALDETRPAEALRSQAHDALAALNPPALPDALRAAGELVGIRFDEVLFAEPPPGGPAEARRRVWSWLTWFLRIMAERKPTVILLENLDQAAPEGLELLAYLHAHLAGVPVLILCEVRRERFSRDPGYFQPFGDGLIQIAPLPREAIAELLMRIADRATLPPTNLTDAVLAASGGLPEAVSHVAQTLQTKGVIQPGRTGWGVDPDDESLVFEFPLSPDDEARHRLLGLEREARSILRRAAVVGSVFWRELLVPLARVDQAGTTSPGTWVEHPDRALLDEILSRAVALGVLHPMNDSTFSGQTEFAFTRAREQAILASEAGPEETLAVHAVVAQWLEFQPGPERDAHLWQVAEHYRLGGNDKRASYYYIRAGDRARRRFANDLAIEAFERARGLLDHRDALPLMDVLHALGALYAMDGRHDRAEREFERMLGLAWGLDHKAKAGAALNRLGRLYRERSRPDRAVELLEQGRSLFGQAEDGPGVAASIDDLGQVAFQQGNRALALELFEESLAYRRAADDERSVAVSLTNLAHLHREMGRLLTAEEYIREALEIRNRIQDLPGAVTSRLALVELLAERGEPDAAWRESNEALIQARRIGDRGQAARALALSALLLAEQGALETARNQAEEAAGIAEQLGDLRTRLRALRAWAMGLSTQDLPAALRALEAAAQLARQHGERLEYGLNLRLIGALHTRQSGIDVHVEAERVREHDEAEPHDSSQAGQTIEELIDETLNADAAADAGARFPPEAGAHLQSAVTAYTEAIGTLESLGTDRETTHALRELAMIVEALGDSAQARALERRARTHAAERRARLMEEAQ